jgi:hypothetical protein
MFNPFSSNDLHAHKGLRIPLGGAPETIRLEDSLLTVKGYLGSIVYATGELPYLGGSRIPVAFFFV